MKSATINSITSNFHLSFKQVLKS
uniref:Uncharacterized protein n=1 Tax=Physcomitrium patens TaxID=3218 RepID=A0A2K1LBK3_PHYPA|nr:hypothetical protein PHYPA_001834 [Physcomitrium patens]